MPEEKIRENRLRRMAERQGMKLTKSRTRDPHALDFGIYRLINAETQVVLFASTSMDEIERELTS